MKPNIGIINAMIRITCGFTILAWVTARLVRRPKQNTLVIVAVMGAMKVAEGITRYCPLTDFLSFSNRNKQHGGQQGNDGAKNDNNNENSKGNDNNKDSNNGQGDEKKRKHRHLSDLDEKANQSK